MSNINVQTLKTEESMFFLVWLKLLQSFLKLGKQEQRILAKFLYYRYKLRIEISNPVVADTVLFGPSYRKKIREDLGINTAAFNNALTALRKKKLIINDKLNNKIIPKVEPGFNNFKLVYNIEIENI